MAATEPALPLPRPASSLRLARDTIVDCVQAWMRSHSGHATIGHAGVLTQEFIFKQAGQGPRSIITVLEGRSERIGGMAVQTTPIWAWYLVMRGTIKDRATAGLDFVGEGQRFIYSDVFRDENPAVFSKPPVGGSVQFKSLYDDKDEREAYSIWVITWRQEITLGAAGRERPGDGQLVVIHGADAYSGTPNGDDVEFKVE